MTLPLKEAFFEAYCVLLPDPSFKINNRASFVFGVIFLIFDNHILVTAEHSYTQSFHVKIRWGHLLKILKKTTAA